MMKEQAEQVLNSILLYYKQLNAVGDKLLETIETQTMKKENDKQ